MYEAAFGSVPEIAHYKCGNSKPIFLVFLAPLKASTSAAYVEDEDDVNLFVVTINLYVNHNALLLSVSRKTLQLRKYTNSEQKNRKSVIVPMLVVPLNKNKTR